MFLYTINKTRIWLDINTLYNACCLWTMCSLVLCNLRVMIIYYSHSLFFVNIICTCGSCVPVCVDVCREHIWLFSGNGNRRNLSRIEFHVYLYIKAKGYKVEPNPVWWLITSLQTTRKHIYLETQEYNFPYKLLSLLYTSMYVVYMVNIVFVVVELTSNIHCLQHMAETDRYDVKASDKSSSSCSLLATTQYTFLLL